MRCFVVNALACVCVCLRVCVCVRVCVCLRRGRVCTETMLLEKIGNEASLSINHLVGVVLEAMR